MKATPEQRAKANAMIKAVYNSGEATINGRVYKFTKTTHLVRRKIFSYFTGIQTELEAGNFSFLDTSGFIPIEDSINRIVTFEGHLIEKLPNHWENFAEDYISFISSAMGVISYPFLKGNLTD